MSTFKLPDIDPAPVSDLQMLLRKLLEDRDLTVVQPLLDELDQLGRTRDLAFVKECLGRVFYSTGLRVVRAELAFSDKMWNLFVPHFWFDLFDTGASLRALQKGLDAHPKVTNVETYGNATDVLRSREATEAIVREQRALRAALAGAVGATRERTPEEHQRWLQEQIFRHTLTESPPEAP